MARTKNLAEYVWGLFHTNVGTRLVSILIALILWGVVLGSRIVEVTKEVPLEVITSSDVIPANDTPDKVAFRLSGPKAFLRSILDRREEPIRVNLTGAKPALVTYRFFSDNIRVPIGVKVVSIIPPAISIQLENVRVKEVPVRLRFQGSLPEGFRILNANVKPDKVQVRGPESQISNLTEIQSKPIDLSVLNSGMDRELPLEVGTGALSILGHKPRVHIEIESVPANFRMKNVDIQVISSYKSEIEEKSVTVLVNATPKEMQTIDKDLVFGVVDMTGKEAGHYVVPVKVNLPQSVRLVKVIPEQVHVKLY